MRRPSAEPRAGDPERLPDAPDAPAPRRGGRILVVKLSSLGDLFHALPAVRRLKEATGASVDWLTQSEYVELVRCFPDADRVLGFHRRGWAPRLPSLLRELRRHRYDLAVDFQGLLKSALLARLARARRVIGPSCRRECTRVFYSAIAGERNKNRHAVEEALDTARFLGCPEGPPEFRVRAPRVRRGEPGVRVALIPFSRWPTKNWAAGNFAALARAIHERIPAAFFVIGGPADADRGADLVRKLKGLRAESCCGSLSLVGTASLLQEMDLAVAVDSGPMHMAAALGVPVLAVFGPTDPARTGPYGEPHRVLWADGLSCRPCFSDACRRGDFACMGRIYPSRVAETAAEMLKFVPRDRLPADS